MYPAAESATIAERRAEEIRIHNRRIDALAEQHLNPQESESALTYQDGNRHAFEISEMEEAQAILDKCKLTVVGEYADMSIVLRSRRHGKDTRIRNIATLTREELLQIAGPAICEHYGDDTGQYKIRRAIAIMAGFHRLAEPLAAPPPWESAVA
jgi:uncharacterized protein (UPF0216 family)